MSCDATFAVTFMFGVHVKTSLDAETLVHFLSTVLLSKSRRDRPRVNVTSSKEII